MPSDLSITAAIVYRILRLAGRVPLTRLHAVGALLGRVLWLTGGRARRIVTRNLELVMPHASADQRMLMARTALVETGKSLAEIAAVWGRDADSARGLVRAVEDEALFRDALAHGGGLIIAAPHLGCWELLNYWLAAQTPLAILYRPPRHAWVEPLLRKARGAQPVEQVRADGAGVRTLYKRLKHGGVVGILPDQQPRGGEGVMAPFFGVPAATMVLLPRLAARTGATVLFAFAERLPAADGFRIRFIPAPEAIADRDPEVACTALNRGLEDCVKVAFAQYQWSYKRYPSDLIAVRSNRPA